MAENDSVHSDFQKGFKDGTAGKSPASRDWEYLGGWKKGIENPTESHHYKRGLRDGEMGRAPSDLSGQYMRGYEAGREKYLAEKEFLMSLFPCWD